MALDKFADAPHAYPEFPAQSSIPIFAADVFAPYLQDDIRSQSCLVVLFPMGESLPSKRIVIVISMGPFADMSGIKTSLDIATMQSTGFRPTSISDEESKSVGSDYVPMKLNLGIGSGARKRPKQAVIGSVSSDSVNKPYSTGRMSRHRCSGKAAV